MVLRCTVRAWPGDAIDTPTLVALLDADEPLGDHQLVAAKDVLSRATDLLLVAVTAGALDEREALERHEALTGVKPRLLGDRVSRRKAFQLAREHGWPTIVQAETLAITRQQADARVSVDASLAALADEVVPVAALADEVVPVAALADEVVPVAALADEVVPVAALADEVVPVAALADEVVPVAAWTDLFRESAGAISTRRT